VPDHDPPNGYICYRCGEKGHWIQMCPTNDDPEYDNRRRVKRTTGIPRSFLTTVDKSVALAQSGGDDESKRPAGIMVNADGDFVIAKPDKASWEKYQAKAKTSAASNEESAKEKELRERGLICPSDKRMFIEPMKTPCCGKTYCNDCITNALIESDFVCPACKADGVLIDDLKPDDEMTDKIKEYLEEKEKARELSKSAGSESGAGAATPHSPAKASSPSPSAAAPEKDAAAASQSPKAASATPSTEKTAAQSVDATQKPLKEQSPTASNSNNATPTTTSTVKATEVTQGPGPKKRPADELMENPKIPKAPRAMQQKMQEQEQAALQQQQYMGGPNGMMGMGNMPGMMPFGGGMNPMMGMPNMGMPMGMPMMNNPMMMNYPMNGNMMFNNGMMPMMNGPMNGGMNPNMNGAAMGRGMNGMNNYPQPNQGFNQAYNQYGQHAGAGAGTGADDDDAYFRKPVNPHRHYNRQKRVRPSDWREL
jgi:protein MPE1